MQTNDVFFALHAVLATLITIVQCFIYHRGSQRLSLWCIAMLALLLVTIAVVGGLTWQGVSPSLTALEFLLFLSYVKLAISVMKYSPQVWLNFRRKSTAGWTIHNVLLDFTGGALSLAQLVMDCLVSGDWCVGGRVGGWVGGEVGRAVGVFASAATFPGRDPALSGAPAPTPSSLRGAPAPILSLRGAPAPTPSPLTPHPYPQVRCGGRPRQVWAGSRLHGVRRHLHLAALCAVQREPRPSRAACRGWRAGPGRRRQ